MNQPIIEGVSPDAPTEVKPNGAKQSASPYRMDLLPPQAQLKVAAILKQGADKYGANNWRGLTIEDNLNHALVHITAYIAGDRQDDHLGHAACRILFATELELTAPKGNLPTRVGSCHFCGGDFAPSEAIYQYHGHSFHKRCLPPNEFPS